MKKSITIQFSLIFISILAGTIILCLAANVLFLKQFYMANLKNDFINVYDMINEETHGTNYFSNNYLRNILDISSRYDMEILIVDENAMSVVTAGMEDDELQRQKYINYIISEENKRILEMQKNPYYFIQAREIDFHNDRMEMIGYFDNGFHFILRSPLENIENHVALANRFLIQVSIFAVALGAIVIMLMTKRITTPIKQLANISNRMANLDFSAHYEPRGDNEIDMLGRHMNVMSNKLEKTISELKTANNDLKRDIEVKNRNEELRKEFLTNMSHELKTPIALIQGYTEGLKDGLHEDAESREFYCDVILDEARRMNSMVRNLMNLSEIEAGKNGAQMTRFDLAELTENILRSMELSFEQAGITIQTQFDKGTFVWADEYQMEEVLRNYISNAINHIDGERIISITFTKYEERVRVTVYNSGKPIPKDSLPYIWDKFYKVDKARTREYGGSGVGLSIVKAIMESMGCKYGVYNHENGVSFYFEAETK